MHPKRGVKVNLDPAGRGSDILTLILGAPAFDERHANNAHLGELVARVETVSDRFVQKLKIPRIDKSSKDSFICEVLEQTTGS